MPILLAARETDEVAHSFEIIGKIVGAVLGAAAAFIMVKGAIVLTGATYGLAAPLIPLAVGFGGMGIAGGAHGGGRIIRGIERMIFGGPLTTGNIASGSPNVMIEKLPAARTVVDTAKCNGKYFLFHVPMPLSIPFIGTGPAPRIAQGAKTVFINDQNAARLTMLIECGAKIKTACKTVYFGGETANQLFTLEGYLDIALDFIGEISATFTRFLFKLYIAALAGPLFGPLAWKYDLGGKLFDGIGYVIGSALDGLAKWGDGIHPGLGDVLAGGAELFMASAPLIRMPTFIKGPWEALKSKAWGKGKPGLEAPEVSEPMKSTEISKATEFDNINRFAELSKDPQNLKPNSKSISEAESILQAENEGIVKNAQRPDLSKGDPNIDFKVDGPSPYKWADVKTPVNRGNLAEQATGIGKKTVLQKGGSGDVLHIIDLKNIPVAEKAAFKAKVLDAAGSTDGIVFINE